MKFLNHRFPWQVLVLISLLLAGCGTSISSKSVGNSLSQHGRITANGSITEFVVPTPGSGPGLITAAPDGAAWFTEQPWVYYTWRQHH